MKRNINRLFFTFLCGIAFSGCSEEDYALGDLSAPTEVSINTEVVGQSATTPNGDGSGDVKITVTGKNILAVKVDYDANDPVDLVQVTGNTITKKYTNVGLNTYRITAVAYGKGGASTTVTKEVRVQSNFTPAAEIVTNLTGGTAKTWVLEKSVSGHFGVGPWAVNPTADFKTPSWYAATPNEKAACCNCFYTAKFTFSKAAGNTYTLQVNAPDGAFTKTGALTTLPGIPASGAEGCYSYGGATSNFSFVPSSSIMPTSASTRTSILLAGNTTYIGYGALQKEYEILSISATSMYLRVRGTEVDNAWYLKLTPQ